MATDIPVATSNVAAADKAISTAAAEIAPRVYILIHEVAQRATARSAADYLEQQGYSIPFIRGASAKVSQNQVRYFEGPADERHEAEKIVELLKAKDVVAKAVAMPRPTNAALFRPRHYELWFAPSTK